MSTWINPLDKVPQVPVDWANHIVQGGVGSVVLMLLLILIGTPISTAVHYSTYCMTALAVTKKVVDYLKEGESWKVCVGKALVTVLWPASLYIYSLYPQVSK